MHHADHVTGAWNVVPFVPGRRRVPKPEASRPVEHGLDSAPAPAKRASCAAWPPRMFPRALALVGDDGQRPRIYAEICTHHCVAGIAITFSSRSGSSCRTASKAMI